VDYFGLRLRLRFHCPFDGTHASELLFEFLFCVSIRFIEGLASFTQIVKVAELVGTLGKSTADRCS